MAANLFVIEAPGKRRALFDVLRRAGVRDIEIAATVGHLAGNPEGFKPLAVDAEYRELAYRVRPEKEQLAATIRAKAADAQRVYLATDDDQEGDVIARDVLKFCIPEDCRHKAVRLRLKSLAPAEVAAALSTAAPFDELMASQGDARRILDRLIGSLSSKAGAVGRVQGSLLIALAEQRPVVGLVTHVLPAADGRGDFVARVPVFAGQAVPEAFMLDAPAEVGGSARSLMSAGPMNHDQILLAASLRTGASVGDVSDAMQRLYEKGRMTYPRAKDCAISREAVKRLGAVASANGAAFRAGLFTGVRDIHGEHAHEAPNPLVTDVAVNGNFELLTLEEQVLVTITRNLIDHGLEGRVDKPVLSQVPPAAQALPWHRLVAVNTRLWEDEPPKAGFRAWTAEQSLLHFMMRNALGRPSTIVHHIDKFLTRDLVTQAFDLTGKGRDWQANIERLLGHRNISKEIEEYIEKNRKPSSQMLMDMVELLQLHDVKSAVGQHEELTSDEEHEIHTGLIP